MHYELITHAWVDKLREFASGVQENLLIISPWIKSSVAYLIASSLSKTAKINVKILARLQTNDFFLGSSDLDVFQNDFFNENVEVAVRGLKNLHAKIYIADTNCAILGSANLTEAGLCGNHEASILTRDSELVARMVDYFERLWSLATAVDVSYFRWMETEVNKLAYADKEFENEGPIKTPDRQFERSREKSPSKIRWAPLQGGNSDRKALIRNETRRLKFRLRRTVIKGLPSLPSGEAMNWLQTLKWAKRTDRNIELTRRLVSLIFHTDVDVRTLAIETVGRLTLQSYSGLIVDILLDKSQPTAVRSAAAFSLGAMGEGKCFGSLTRVCRERNDVGRWATHCCFMFLARIEPSEQESFFDLLGLDTSVEYDTIAKRIGAHTGSVTERFAKAIFLENLILRNWGDLEFKLIVYIQHEIFKQLTQQKRFESYLYFIREVSKALKVRRGDLTKGILSITMIKRVGDNNWPEGLNEYLAKFTAQLRSNEQAFAAELRDSLRLHGISPLFLMDLTNAKIS